MNGGGGMTNGGGVDLYLLAGVKTWPTYFREPAERLKAMSINAGYADANVHVLYPYGDHTIPLHRQLLQVARDVARRMALATDRLQPADFDLIEEAAVGFPEPQHDSFGQPPAASGSPEPRHDSFGQPPATAVPTRRSGTEALHAAIVDAIRERSAGRVVVLIGHSGGGVAAYYAGRRLLAERAVRDCRIVQVGSPKVRIHPALRDRTAYFYAVNERGRRSDPVTRFGTWGGIRRAAAGIPVWDPRRWAPGHIAGIAIDGGHKDYFMHGPSGAPGETTNLERTAEAVFDWLIRSLRPLLQPTGEGLKDQHPASDPQRSTDQHPASDPQRSPDQQPFPLQHPSPAQ